MSTIVVIVHTYKGELFDKIEDEYAFLGNIMFFLSGDVGRMTIPFFFAISGFLFFRSCNNFTLEFYKSQVKKRFVSVFIPYLIVSILGIVIAYLLYRFTTDNYLYINANRVMTDFSIPSLLETLFFKPQAYHLWFIRNLFYISLMTPIIYLLIKRLNYFFLIPLLLIWLLFRDEVAIQYPSFVYFSVGAFLSIKKVDLSKSKNIQYPIIATILWLSLCYLVDFSRIPLPATLHSILVNASVVCGMLSFWFIYDFIKDSHKARISNSYIGQYTFYIYLFHEPMQSFLIQLLNHNISLNSITAFITYLLIPAFVMIICSLFAVALKKYSPKIYTVLGGGR